MEQGDTWYRFEDKYYSPGADEWGDPLPGTKMEVHLFTYKVIKRTPKGVWLSRWGYGAGQPGWHTKARFVLNEATRRFACPTEEEAKQSFIARKQKQASIYRKRAEQAEKAIAIVKRSLYRHEANGWTILSGGGWI